MARLNELPAPVDNFDILRRKFLRQNRDIARVNSNQSLRIRGLENECARLLSENLDLRGQVLRLEKEIQDDKSQRVADHAILIKEKMEAQLVELGALLAGFGLEPPTKRQSPIAARHTNEPVRLSLSIQSTPPRSKRPVPLSPGEAESLAAQEGRLPPIYETKTFPRQTLGQDEILALQADDQEAAASPELRPPPVLRMLRDDGNKTSEASNKPKLGIFDRDGLASKTKAADVLKEQAKPRPTEEEHTTKAQSTAPAAAAAAAATKQSLVPEKKTATTKTTSTTATTTPSPAAVDSAAAMPAMVNSVPSATSSRGSGKRKFAVSDENAALRGIKAGNENNKPTPATQKDHTDKSAQIRELKNPRSIRSLVSNRKGTQDDATEAAAPTRQPLTRQPLAAKSTNKDISTPRKQALSGKDKPKDSNGSSNAGKPTEAAGRMRGRTKLTVAANISGASPVETADIHLGDKTTDTADTTNATNSPAPSEAPRQRRQSAKPEPTRFDHDRTPSDEPGTNAVCPSTPPPPPPPSSASSASLSSQKMVVIHGEGRDTPPPADISSQGEVSRPSRRSRTSVSYAEPNLRDKMRRPTKQLFDAVAGEGKYVQRHSLQHQHSQDQDGYSEEGAPTAGPEKMEPLDSAADHQQMANVPPVVENVQKQNTPDQDPYEFTVLSASSSNEADEAAEAATGKNKAASSSKKANSKASSRGPRRASSANANANAPRDDDSSATDRQTRPTASRKRSSMASTKRGSLLDSDEEDQADSSYEPSAAESTDAPDTEGRAASARERISRRRSMML